MLALINAYLFFLRCFYAVAKLAPARDRVVFVSRQSNEIPMDFQLVIDEIAAQKLPISVKTICTKVYTGDSLLRKGLSYLRYAASNFYQAHHIARAKIVVIDSYCMPVSTLKHKDELTVVQFWHSMGSMKEFGYSILDNVEGRSRKVADTLKMHRNYDYIFASSEVYVDRLARGFDADPSTIKIFPLPRYDLLKSAAYSAQVRQEIFTQHPDLNNGKKTIVYCPTFRKHEEGMSAAVDQMIQQIDLDRFNLVVKLHVLSSIEIADPRVHTLREYPSFDALFIADYVISDYSCIIYEAALLDKALLFYCFDLDEYVANRGVNVDLDELPGPVRKDFAELNRELEADNFDLAAVSRFADKYVEPTDNATADIVSFLLRFL